LYERVMKRRAATAGLYESQGSLAVLRGVTRFCGIALRGLLRLPIEKDALFVYTPIIARKRPITADDTVTGNRHSKVTGGASACHGADRFGRTNTAGDLCIRDGLSCKARQPL
jgi:hypothetical protein